MDDHAFSVSFLSYACVLLLVAMVAYSNVGTASGLHLGVRQSEK